MATPATTTAVDADADPRRHAVEQEVAFDMIRRALPVAPALVGLAWVVWGGDGALSALFAVGLVLVNFAVSATILSRAARLGVNVLLVAALGGYVVRLGLVLVALLAVRDQAWVAMVPLGITLLVTHLGLLVWEARHVSLSLAFPGLKPPRGA
jgi:hypothetical protein